MFKQWVESHGRDNAMSKRARKVELKQILNSVYYKTAVTKPELAEEFDVSLTAISSYVNQLERSGWLRATVKGESSGGRKPILFELNPQHRYILGVNLQTDHFYLFLADLQGDILGTRLISISDYSFGYYTGMLTDATLDLLQELNIDSKLVLGMGICISGVTDFGNRIVERSKKLDWNYMPLSQVIEQRLGIPAYVENDSRVYARNEIDPNDPNHVGVVVYLAHSVGLALVIDNKVFSGYSNRAGDNRFFGEPLKRMMEIINENEVIHDLTFKPYYSAVDRATIETLSDTIEKHMEEHPESLLVIDEFTTQLATLMITMINIVNPKRILLTGNVVDFTNIVYRQVKRKILDAKRVYHIPEVRRTATLKNPLETALVKFVLEKFFMNSQTSV